MTRSVSFSMLHSLVFFGIVVYFLPGGWTSAQNQDAVPTEGATQSEKR